MHYMYVLMSFIDIAQKLITFDDFEANLILVTLTTFNFKLS